MFMKNRTMDENGMKLRVTEVRKVCNKYDLPASQCFWLAHHNDWSKWFVISSLPPICCPSFSFIGGVAKEYFKRLGCEKYIRASPGVLSMRPCKFIFFTSKFSYLLFLQPLPTHEKRPFWFDLPSLIQMM
jgi:hypothetical protein